MKVLYVCGYASEQLMDVRGDHETASPAANTKVRLITESLVRTGRESALLAFVSIMSSEKTAGGWTVPVLRGGRTITGIARAVVCDMVRGRVGDCVQMPSTGGGR